MVFLSTGMPGLNPMIGNPDLPDTLGELQDFIREAHRANIAVYAVDPRGLFNPDADVGAPAAPTPESRFAEQEKQDVLRVIADATGGRAIVSTNTFGRGFDQLLRDSASYYIVGYYTSVPQDGKAHRIGVRVRRERVEVRTANKPQASRELRFRVM
jgi:VWFA-related protein